MPHFSRITIALDVLRDNNYCIIPEPTAVLGERATGIFTPSERRPFAFDCLYRFYRILADRFEQR